MLIYPSNNYNLKTFVKIAQNIRNFAVGTKVCYNKMYLFVGQKK